MSNLVWYLLALVMLMLIYVLYRGREQELELEQSSNTLERDEVQRDHAFLVALEHMNLEQIDEIRQLLETDPQEAVNILNDRYPKASAEEGV